MYLSIYLSIYLSVNLSLYIYTWIYINIGREEKRERMQETVYVDNDYHADNTIFLVDLFIDLFFLRGFLSIKQDNYI